MKYKAEIILLVYTVIICSIMMFINDFIVKIPFMLALFDGMMFGVMAAFLFIFNKEEK